MDESSSLSLLPEERETRNSRGCFNKILDLLNGEEDEDLKDIQPVSFLQLFRFASPRVISIYFIAFLLIFFLGFITPVHQWLGGRIATIYIQEKEPVGNDEFLWRVWSWASIYGGMFLIALVVEYLQNYLFTWASEQIGNECRRRFIEAVLSRDSLQSDESTGELSNQLSSHIDRMKEGLGEKVGEFVRCLSTFLTCCTISFILDWQTALILFWSGPVYLLTTLIPRLSSNAAKQSLKVSEEANGIAEESILNVKTVASCNGQKQMIDKYSSILRSGLSPSLRIAIVSGFLDALSNLLYVVFHSIGLWWATISFHNGRITAAGDVFAVTFLALSSAGSFSQLGPHLISVMKARAAAAIVYKTIDSVESHSSPSTQPKLDPSRANLSIEFRDVSFSFPSRAQAVLRNLSFTLQSGESIGLVGKSGCGKSTMFKLLTRFLEEQSGSILLDSVPLCEYDKKKWREMMGVVSQEPCLFTGSIRENICLGRDFTDREVEDACRMAHAHDFIVALDKGYDTLLGSSGVSLSGGQKQRIAIARAIVSQPRLLLLDEATSALDSKSERIVQKALDSASQGRSTIVVAHRLSTIKNVDKVIVMQEGEIVESGDYFELRTKDGGIFSRMVTEQEMERRSSKDVSSEESDDSFEDIETETATDERRHSEEIAEGVFTTAKGGFLAVLGRDKWKTFVIFVLGILKAFASILLSARFFFIFGSLEDNDYQPLLFWLTVGTIAVGLYNFFFQFISQPICQYLGETVMNEMRVSCLRSLLHRPLAYFDRQSTSPSACAVLLSQQPPTALSMIDHKLSTVVDGLVSCFGVIILTFIVCLPSGVVGVFYLVVYLILLLAFEKINDNAYQQVVEVDKSGELAMEIFDNVATIQQLAVESHFQQKFDDILERRDVPLAKKIKCQSIVHSTNWSIFLAFNFIATTVGVYFVYLGHYTTKQLFTTESLVADIGFATYLMSFSFKDMVSASSAAKLLFGLIDPTREENGENEMKLNTKGSLKTEKVTFAYPSQPQRNVLDDVSFAVGQGKSIAFVGPSGGGKSTIVNLLERFYDPKSGRILLDHLPFTSLTPFQIRSDIALVSQEPILFRGSIADNVRIGTEGVSDDEVKRACDMANASEFIRDFPEGYSTLVGEKGRSLSGGQKQRIAIARALVRNPKVIILDEATSALDTQSEKVVRSALESSARGRTSVMIAHRLDTIRHCDEICFVEGGKIVERGNHDDLMKRRGKYHDLTQQQNLH